MVPAPTVRPPSRMAKRTPSSSATGVAFGEPGNDRPYSDVLTNFVPLLRAAGVSQEHLEQMLITNTARLLSVIGEDK